MLYLTRECFYPSQRAPYTLCPTLELTVSQKVPPPLETPGKGPGYTASRDLHKWMSYSFKLIYQVQMRQDTSRRAEVAWLKPGGLSPTKENCYKLWRDRAWGVHHPGLGQEYGARGERGVQFSVLITKPSIRNTPTCWQTQSVPYTYSRCPSERRKHANYQQRMDSAQEDTWAWSTISVTFSLVYAPLFIIMQKQFLRFSLYNFTYILLYLLLLYNSRLQWHRAVSILKAFNNTGEHS